MPSVVHDTMTTPTSHSAALWTTKHTIAGTSFEGSTQYVCIWTGLMKSDSSSTIGKVRLRSGSYIMPSSQFDVCTGSSSEYMQVGMIFSLYAAASPTDVTVQLSIPSPYTGTTYLTESHFVAFEVGSYNTDWDEAGWSSLTTLDATWSAYASGSQTDGDGDDYLHLGCPRFQVDDLTYPIQARLHYDETTVSSEMYDEPRTTDEVRGWVMAHVWDNVPDNTDIETELKSTNAATTNDVASVSNNMIKLQWYENHEVSQTSGATSSLGSSYAEVDTIDFTPTATGDHLIIYSAIWNPSTADYALYGRMQVDNTTVAGEDSESMAYAASSSCEVPVMLFAVEDFDDLTERAIDVDFSSDQASSGTLTDRMLIVLSMADAPTDGAGMQMATATKLQASAAAENPAVFDFEKSLPWGAISLALRAGTETATDLAPTTKFNTIQTTGDVTVQDGATIDELTVDAATVILADVVDLTDVLIVGDVEIETAGTYGFSNVEVTGDITNEDATGNVTINSSNGSSLSTTEPGTGNGQVNIANAVTVLVTVVNADGSGPVVGARVYLEADTGGPLSVGTEILHGVTNASGVVSTDSFNYTSAQPLVGTVRRGTATPLYGPAPVTGTITTVGYSTRVFLVRDD